MKYTGMDKLDRQGKPLDMWGWAKLREDPKYIIVKQETVNDKFISTVWLGLNHNFGTGKPLIFETMVFPSKEGEWGEEYCERYSTEAQALRGHKRIVKKILKETLKKGGIKQKVS